MNWGGGVSTAPAFVYPKIYELYKKVVSLTHDLGRYSYRSIRYLDLPRRMAREWGLLSNVGRAARLRRDVYYRTCTGDLAHLQLNPSGF